jgi:hypothetical protein
VLDELVVVTAAVVEVVAAAVVDVVSAAVVAVDEEVSDASVAAWPDSKVWASRQRGAREADTRKRTREEARGRRRRRSRREGGRRGRGGVRLARR